MSARLERIRVVSTALLAFHFIRPRLDWVPHVPSAERGQSRTGATYAEAHAMVYGSDETYPGESAERAEAEQRREEAMADMAKLVPLVRVTSELEETRQRLEYVRHQRDELAKVARATLLFYRSSPWTSQYADEWRALTGRKEATTKALCDFIRETLEGVGVTP